MEKEARLEMFKTNLTKLIMEGKEGSVVIFDTPEKYVQFAGCKGWMACDIPTSQLTKDEEKRLLNLKQFSDAECATDAKTGETISYQSHFEEEGVDEASELVEKIFTEVYRLPQDYDVKAELNLAG